MNSENKEQILQPGTIYPQGAWVQFRVRLPLDEYARLLLMAEYDDCSKHLGLEICKLINTAWEKRADDTLHDVGRNAKFKKVLENISAKMEKHKTPERPVRPKYLRILGYQPDNE